EEFGTLVLLHSHGRAAPRRVLGSQLQYAAKAALWRDEAATERATIIRDVLTARHDLAVGVLELDLHGFLRQRGIVVALAIDADAEALVLDRLARPIEGAIGEEERLLGRLRLVRFAKRHLIRMPQATRSLGGHQGDDRHSILEVEEAVSVGPRGGPR